MTLSRQMLANLIGSRICHDLISPIGAINNGIVLLTWAKLNNSNLTILISEGCRNGFDLKKNWTTFGQDDENQKLSAQRADAILKSVLSCERISLRCNLESRFSYHDVKAIFLSLICLYAAAIRGGEFAYFSTMTAVLSRGIVTLLSKIKSHVPS